MTDPESALREADEYDRLAAIIKAEVATALREYGEHKVTCQTRRDGGARMPVDDQRCDCGLRAALAATPSPPVEAIFVGGPDGGHYEYPASATPSPALDVDAALSESE